MGSEGFSPKIVLNMMFKFLDFGRGVLVSSLWGRGSGGQGSPKGSQSMEQFCWFYVQIFSL